jgi:DNA polymerase-3 subunit gamma/tau
VSHLALARKYRPQRFADLVGQDPVRLTLERAVATNRVAHAYLFAGPRGSGKTTTARLIAKALNCENRKDGEAEPCNACRTCAEIAAGASMDVLEIDGASNRGIEEIRNLRENVKYSPSGGKSKVYIIDEAHQLTDFAWNALLKTLEEPPPHVRFVFATTEPLEVPDTIASRCQVFEFRRLKSGELITHLLDIAGREAVRLEEDAAALIARAAEGSVRDALSRFDQALSVAPGGVTADTVAQALGLAGLEAFFDLGGAIAARDPKQALEILDRLYDGGMDMEEMADGLAHHLRQLLLLAVDPSLSRLIDAAPADRERYSEQATRFRANDLSAMMTLLLASRGSLRRAEAPRALLEVCLVELCTLPTAGPIDDLIRRLEALESRLGSGGAGAPPRSTSGGSSGPRAEAPAPPTPGPAPAASGSDLAPWTRTIERVKAQKLLLGTCLEEGAFLGLAGTMVRIALSPEHSFHKAMLEMKENKEILNQEIEREFGRGATLSCLIAEAGKGPAASPNRIRAELIADAIDLAAEEGAEAPAEIVKRIVEIFDGEIVEGGGSADLEQAGDSALPGSQGSGAA